MSDGKNATQTSFYVSKGEQTLGPWTIDEISDRLTRSEIAVTDFVFEDACGDWTPILECAALKERLRKAKPKAPPPKQATPLATGPTSPSVEQHAKAAPQATIATETKTPTPAPTPTPTPAPASAHVVEEEAEWFVQKGNDRYGPLTYMALIKALQEKSVYEFDYIWKNGMEQWVRLAEHEEFKAENIRALHNQIRGATNVFSSRRHPRVPFESEVIVHDNRSVWMGRSFEGSEGGSGLIIENAALIPGQVLLMHFASHGGLPAFNALCEIVSKKYSKDLKDSKTPVAYGVKFIKLDAGSENQVQEYFRGAAKVDGASAKTVA